MSVVSMRKVQVVVHQHDADAFLTVMQRHGAMEFTELTNEQLADTLSAAATGATLLPRVQHAIAFLEPYEKKRGLWQSLREGSTTDVSEADLMRRRSDTDAVESIVKDVEALQVEFAEKTAEVKHLEEQKELLEAWKAVPAKLTDLNTKKTVSFLLTIDDVVTLQKNLAEKDLLHVAEVIDGKLFVTIIQADIEVFNALVSETGAVIMQQPHGEDTAATELSKLEEKLATATGTLGLVHDQVEHVTHTHLNELRIAGELLEWERDRFATRDLGKGTKTTAVFSGWLVADVQSAIETELTEKKIAAVFSEVPFAEGEEPPVEITNSALVRPFEVVTRLYGMPGYKDLDPTLFLAGFFFLFFGLSLTDVGYGATLAVISAGLLIFAKLQDGVRMMVKLLLYIGIATVMVGALFGGYFGIAPEQLPAPLQALQMFDPIGNPLPVFYLALGLGVFQVMVGLILKIYSDARNKQLLDGLWEQGPWLLLFLTGILYVLTVVQYVEVSVDLIVRLVYIGGVLLVIGALRKSRTILEALMNVGGSLYGSVGFLSDILSYSRLLALGLATTALAFAVNLIAGIVYGDGGFVGAILAVIILVIGHVFTLAVNTLGAFIHSARLQFVEFFGKFVVGTGRSFAPLSRSCNHISVTKE